MILMLLEVEECLVDIIVNEKKGLLQIGPFKGRVEGGANNGNPGIQERVKQAAEAAGTSEDMEAESSSAAHE